MLLRGVPNVLFSVTQNRAAAAATAIPMVVTVVMAPAVAVGVGVAGSVRGSSLAARWILESAPVLYETPMKNFATFFLRSSSYLVIYASVKVPGGANLLSTVIDVVSPLNPSLTDDQPVQSDAPSAAVSALSLKVSTPKEGQLAAPPHVPTKDFVAPPVAAKAADVGAVYPPQWLVATDVASHVVTLQS